MKPEGLGPSGPPDKGPEVTQPTAIEAGDGISLPVEPPAASRPGAPVDTTLGNRFAPQSGLGENKVSHEVQEETETPHVSEISEGDVTTTETALTPPEPPSPSQDTDEVVAETEAEIQEQSADHQNATVFEPDAGDENGGRDEIEIHADELPESEEPVGNDVYVAEEAIELGTTPVADPLTVDDELEATMNENMARSVVQTAESEKLTDEALALTEHVTDHLRYTYLVKIEEGKRALGFEPTEEIKVKAKQLANPDNLDERHLLEGDKITELMYVGRLGNDRGVLSEARDRINSGKFDDEPEPQLLTQNTLRRRLAIHHADLGDYDAALDIVDEMEPLTSDLSFRTKTKIFSERVELMKYILDKEQGAGEAEGAAMPSSAERIYRAITQFPPDTYLDGTQNQRDAVLSGVADCCVKAGDYIAAEHCVGKISDTTLKLKGYLTLARDYGKSDNSVALTDLQREIAGIFKGDHIPPDTQELMQTAVAQGHMDAGQVDFAIFPIITGEIEGANNIAAVTESFFKNPQWTANEGSEKVFDQVRSLPKQYQIDVLSLATSSMGEQKGEIVDSQKAKLKDRLEKFAQAVRDDLFIEDRDRAELLAKAMETHITLTDGKSDTLYASFAADTEGIPLMAPVSRAIVKSHFKMGQYDKAFEFIDQVRPLALYTDVIPLLPNDTEVHEKLQEKIMSGALTESYRINLLMSLAGKQLSAGMDSTVNLEEVKAMIEGTRGAPESKIDLLLTLARLYRTEGMNPDQIMQLDDTTRSSLKSTGIDGIDGALQRYKSAA